MSERLTVDELFAMTRDFLVETVANIEHDGLVCHRCNELVTGDPGLSGEDATWRVAAIMHYRKDAKQLSGVTACVLCEVCQKSLDGQRVYGKAPAYDELLP